MFMMNDEQKANLTVLRDFLDQNRDSVKLDMEVFCAITDYDDEDFEELSLEEFRDQGLLEQGKECGASMCMLGWAGTIFSDKIGIDSKGRLTKDWQDVGLELFGTHNIQNTVGNFLFSSDWSERRETNTIDHAIYRINRVLQASTESDYENIADEWEDFIRGEGLYE